MTHSPGEVPHGLPGLSIFPDSAGDAQGDVADSRVCYNGRMDDVFEVFGAVYPEAGRPALTRQRVAWARERPLAGLTVLSSSRKDPVPGLLYLSLGESGVYRDVVMAYSDEAYYSKIAGMLTDEIYTVIHHFLNT